MNKAKKKARAQKLIFEIESLQKEMKSEPEISHADKIKSLQDKYEKLMNKKFSSFGKGYFSGK